MLAHPLATLILTEKFCSELVVKNGAVSSIGRVKQDTVVTFTCSKRHALFGEKKVMCQATGLWSSNPECRKCGEISLKVF